MKTLREWLEEAQADPVNGASTGINMVLTRPMTLVLFQGQDKQQALTGQVAVEVHFYSDDGEVDLYGQLELFNEAPKLDEIAEVVEQVFGIKPDDAVWDVEDL